MTSALQGFSTYLAISGPGRRAEDARARLGEDTVHGTRKHWAGRVITPDATREAILRELGEPDESSSDAIAYRLPGFEGFLYRFRFSARHGGVIENGFVRLDVPPTLPPLPASSAEHAAFLQVLDGLDASASELRSAYGEPERIDGWWPIETWEYPRQLCIDLRHGRVEHG